MDVAIGLPNAVPGATGGQLTEWARRADARGFSSLGTIDRIVYDNYEPLIALAAAAAVTERIGLCTSVLLGPLRVNATELAKQALSLHALSAGRFTLGIGLGGRDDDYEASGIELTGRGRELDAMLERIREVWSGGEVGPSIEGPPRLVIGGHANASFERAARFADGWIAAGSGPDQFSEGAARRRRLGRRRAATGSRGLRRSLTFPWATARRRRRALTSPTTTPGSARRSPSSSSPAPPRIRTPSSSTSPPTRRRVATS